MGKVKKKYWVFALLACLLIGVGATTSAAQYSYNKELKPPFNGCAAYTPAYTSSVIFACVEPSTNTMNTTYTLLMPTTTQNVSSYVKTGTAGSYGFTYHSGYGGSGQKYRMVMYPSSSNFSKYTVVGTWQP